MKQLDKLSKEEEKTTEKNEYLEFVLEALKKKEFNKSFIEESLNEYKNRYKIDEEEDFKKEREEFLKKVLSATQEAVEKKKDIQTNPPLSEEQTTPKEVMGEKGAPKKTEYKKAQQTTAEFNERSADKFQIEQNPDIPQPPSPAKEQNIYEVAAQQQIKQGKKRAIEQNEEEMEQDKKAHPSKTRNTSSE